MKTEYDVVVIGGGSAGLAAAIEAKKNGADNVLILERDQELGGILPQCIHNGFGSVLFKKDYPGPYYAQKFIDEALDLKIDLLLDTMVLDITASKLVYAASCNHLYQELKAKAIVLAMGCRERTRAQIRIPGSRPAGVFTAGTVQRFVNIEGYMPGKRYVILGSGDIGMIMARRLTLEGAKVERVLEIMPFLAGLRRNYVQCLQDFDLQLDLQCSINRIIGRRHIEAIESIQVDHAFNPIKGTEEIIPCDCLLLSVGLIPENELSKKAGINLDPVTGGPLIDERMETSLKGVFAAGNVVNIHDLVDYVSIAGNTAGKNAALFAAGKLMTAKRRLRVQPGENVHQVVPQLINLDWLEQSLLTIELRVNRQFEGQVKITITAGKEIIFECREKYARPAEMIVIKPSGSQMIKKIKPNLEILTIAVTEL